MAAVTDSFDFWLRRQTIRNQREMKKAVEEMKQSYSGEKADKIIRLSAEFNNLMAAASAYNSFKGEQGGLYEPTHH